MLNAHNGDEIEASGRRTFPWKGRSIRAQQQQQQNTLLQLPESSSDVSYRNRYSDTISIPSRTSSEHLGDIDENDKNKTARSGQVDLQDSHDYFTQAPSGHPMLQGFQCSLRNDDLVNGQLFIKKPYICFKSNTSDPAMTTVEFKVENIKSIDLVRPGRWKPRMIQITLKKDAKYTFTAFLPSIVIRDQAYQCLMDTWQLYHLPIGACTSTSISPTPTPSYCSPPSILKSKSTSEFDGSDTTTSDNNKSNECQSTTAPTTPTPTGPFKLFQRKRAQTVVTQAHQESQRSQSVTSSSTLLAKSLNTQVIWNDGQSLEYMQSKESNPLTISTTTTLPIQQPQQPILLDQKTKLPSSPARSQSPSSFTSPPLRQHLFTRINTRTMLMIAGFILLLSHAFLTYQLYHMTNLLTTRQLQQHQQQRHQQKVALSFRQQQDVSWLSDQLEKAAKEVHRWEKETLQQKEQLKNMIPS